MFFTKNIIIYNTKNINFEICERLHIIIKLLNDSYF